MLSLPSTLIATKNKLFCSGGYIELLEVQISELGETLRITSNNQDVEWGGYTWTRFPIQGGDVEENAEGEVPQLEVRVSNALRVVQGYVEQTENMLEGDTAILRVVHSDHLGEQAYLTEQFGILGVHCGIEWVTFTLGAENPFMWRFPLNMFKRNVCQVKRFKDADCLYSGSATTCNRKFGRCISYGNQARYRGFPGLLGGAFDVST